MASKPSNSPDALYLVVPKKADTLLFTQTATFETQAEASEFMVQHLANHPSEEVILYEAVSMKAIVSKVDTIWQKRASSATA